MTDSFTLHNLGEGSIYLDGSGTSTGLPLRAGEMITFSQGPQSMTLRAAPDLRQARELREAQDRVVRLQRRLEGLEARLEEVQAFRVSEEVSRVDQAFKLRARVTELETCIEGYKTLDDLAKEKIRDLEDRLKHRDAL